METCQASAFALARDGNTLNLGLWILNSEPDPEGTQRQVYAQQCDGSLSATNK